MSGGGGNGRRCGFRIHHEEGYCWFPFRRASNSALVPYAVRVERGLGLGKLASVSPWVAFVAKKQVDGEAALSTATIGKEGSAKLLPPGVSHPVGAREYTWRRARRSVSRKTHGVVSGRSR